MMSEGGRKGERRRRENSLSRIKIQFISVIIWRWEFLSSFRESGWRDRYREEALIEDLFIVDLGQWVICSILMLFSYFFFL